MVVATWSFTCGPSAFFPSFASTDVAHLKLEDTVTLQPGVRHFLSLDVRVNISPGKFALLGTSSLLPNRECFLTTVCDLFPGENWLDNLFVEVWPWVDESITLERGTPVFELCLYDEHSGLS